GNEKTYLSVIAVLILVLAYLLMNGGQAVSEPAPVAKAPIAENPNAEAESLPVVEDWGGVPDSWKPWLEKNNIRSLILFNDKLQARVAGKDYKAAKVCAHPVKGSTRMTGQCTKIKASTLTRATNINIELFENSPGTCCTSIYGQRMCYSC
ncbi:MAG: hypothetical protein ABFS02_10575, partial [Pseudomonadota bacterium]